MMMMLSVVDVFVVHGKVEVAYEFADVAEFVVIVVETKKLQMVMVVVVVEYWA
jgi:hypothetical protein